MAYTTLTICAGIGALLVGCTVADKDDYTFVPDSQLASTGGSAGTSGGMSGSDNQGGSTGSVDDCIENEACSNGADTGLCVDGVCSGCVDVTDDAACVAAYGADYLCIDGACVPAQCRAEADCADAGNTCVDGMCVSSACTKDGECTDSTTPVCDVDSGECVSAEEACTGKAAGDACAGADSGHLCCGATLSCQTIECCTDAECPEGQACSLSGTCASDACTVVSGQGPYYVDAEYSGTNGSTGDSSCPFTSITQALAFVTNANNPQNVSFNVTIMVVSAISEDNEGVGAFPIYVPSRVVIEGSPSSDGEIPVVTVPDGITGFIFNYDKPPASQAFGGISYLTITQPTAVTDDTKQGYGIQVTATHLDVAQKLTSEQSINIDHVTVHKFRHGIRVDTGGYADLGPEISASGNYMGVYASNGYVNIGHTTAGTDAPSHFDDNLHSGIYIDGASILHIKGDDLTNAFGKTMTAIGNHYGIRLRSIGAIPSGLTNLIQGVEMSNNSYVDMAVSHGAGLFVYAGGNTVDGEPGNQLKIRNSLFVNNYQAIHIHADSNAANPNHVQNIDLGVDGTNDPGENVMSGTGTLLCIATNTSVAYQDGNGPLNVAGNTWETNSCAAASPTYKLTSAATCTGETDVGFDQGTINKSTGMINATCLFK